MERDPRLRPEFFWEQSAEMREKILYEDLLIARKERNVIRHYALVAFVSALVAMFVVTIVIIVIFAGAQSGDRQRQYELCLGGNRTRGAIQAVLLPLPSTNIEKLQKRFPVLDCGPVLDGNKSVTLSYEEQKRFARYVMKYDEPPKVRDGRVLNEPEVSRGDFAPSNRKKD